MECFRCEASGDEVLLFDAITSKGIVKICGRCSKEENIPVINKPSVSRFDEYKQRTKVYSPEKSRKSVVYSRLSQMSGIEVKDGRDDPARAEELAIQEKRLKSIADSNFERKLPVQDSNQKKKQYPHLVDNFHWIIMRARRSRKLTTENFAKEIAEPESAVKMAEKGILPEDHKKLIGKIESRLGILLLKKEFREKERAFSERQVPEKIDFKSGSAETITIADLREMRKKREDEILFGSKPKKQEGGFSEEVVFNEAAEKAEDEPEFVMVDLNKLDESVDKNQKPFRHEKEPSGKEEKELTDEEIDDIIFGRR